jgi:hypothetical protein
MAMEHFIPTHGISFWLWNIFAIFIIWSAVNELVSGKRKPVKSDYIQALDLTAEEADFLFMPTTDRLYNIVEPVRKVALPLTAILFLIVSYVPGAAGQAWIVSCFHVSAAIAFASCLLILIFRGRTAAKANRLSNIDNFKPDPITGNLPKTSDIYSHDILLFRIGAFIMLVCLGVSLHDWITSLIFP